ncbi:MAG: 3-methyladenine DNA glycosylase [Opitutaceae bacterium]|nr:3-methyladenine DNA glycosylase [Opitutaceae bacterium]|tara:strand:- start:1669 stop:2226 length:558 start_codon:yes stop_codon:yes gene_type:complete
MPQGKLLKRDFFERSVLEICPELLGHFLVVRVDGNLRKLEIREIEAYDGPSDKACHAAKGRTPRTEVLFGPAACWYVYLCYGVHWLLNVVSGPIDYPAAILIRGVGEHGGPGILTRELKIDNRFNTLKSSRETGLWMEKNPNRLSDYPFATTPRIGVDYADEWAEKPYRFISIRSRWNENGCLQM